MEIIDVIKDEDVEVSLLKNIPVSFLKNNQIFPIKKNDSELVGAVTDEGGCWRLPKSRRFWV